MDEYTPPKKATKTRKNISKKQLPPEPTPTAIGDVSVPLTPAENEIFLKQINSFLERKEEARRAARDNVSDYNALQANVSEFLESYIVFGYTFTGERVLIQNWPTPKDKDALLEFLKNVFILNSPKETDRDYE